MQAVGSPYIGRARAAHVQISPTPPCDAEVPIVVPRLIRNPLYVLFLFHGRFSARMNAVSLASLALIALSRVCERVGSADRRENSRKCIVKRRKPNRLSAKGQRKTNIGLSFVQTCGLTYFANNLRKLISKLFKKDTRSPLN